MKSILYCLCLVVTLSACNQSSDRPAEIPAVKTVKAISADAGMALVFASAIQPRYQSQLAFRVGGKLLTREAHLGSHVKQGQVLAQLDPADLKLSAAASQAQVASVKADYIYAKAELERYKQLRAQSYVSAAAYEVRKNSYDAALARLNAAKAQAAVSTHQAGYSNLIADYDGIITTVNADPGQVIAAGQPIMTLARTESLDAVINVAESQIQQVRAARYVDISLWSDPDKVYHGHIREIAGAADIASRTYEVKIQIDKPDNDLKLGMTATVVMHGAAGIDRSTTLIPLTALLQSQQQAAVYVLDADNRLAVRKVKVMQYRERDALISTGLQPGERLVALGVHKLHAGEHVSPIPAGSLFASDAKQTPTNVQ
mgnify:CR=1 FL=1